MSAIRYILVGVVVYCIDILSYVLMFKLIGLEPYYANLVAKFIGGCFGFWGHRKFTFRVQSGKKIRHAIKYFIMLIVYAPITSFILEVILKLIHYPIVAKLISDVICIIGSYLLTKYIVFRYKKHC